MYWSGKTSITMFGKKREVILSIDGNEDANFSSIQCIKKIWKPILTAQNGLRFLMKTGKKSPI